METVASDSIYHFTHTRLLQSQKLLFTEHSPVMRYTLKLKRVFMLHKVNSYTTTGWFATRRMMIKYLKYNVLSVRGLWWKKLIGFLGNKKRFGMHINLLSYRAANSHTLDVRLTHLRVFTCSHTENAQTPKIKLRSTQISEKHMYQYKSTPRFQGNTWCLTQGQVRFLYSPYFCTTFYLWTGEAMLFVYAFRIKNKNDCIEKLLPSPPEIFNLLK